MVICNYLSNIVLLHFKCFSCMVVKISPSNGFKIYPIFVETMTLRFICIFLAPTNFFSLA